MIPYILAAVGGYLIGDSLKGQQFAKGGSITVGYYLDPTGKKYFIYNEKTGNISRTFKTKKEAEDYLKKSRGADDLLKGKQYAEGGKIYEVAIDEGELGTRTLADFESKIEAESFLREYKAKNPDSKLFIDSITSDFSTNYAEGGMMARGGLTQSDSLQSLGKKELENVYFDAIYKNWEKIDSENAKEYAEQEMYKSKFRVLNEKQFEQILPTYLGVEEKRIYQINGKQKKLIDIFERSIMFGKKPNWERI